MSYEHTAFEEGCGCLAFLLLAGGLVLLALALFVPEWVTQLESEAKAATDFAQECGAKRGRIVDPGKGFGEVKMCVGPDGRIISVLR